MHRPLPTFSNTCHLFTVDGALVFSPNSTRVIGLPPSPIENRVEVNPFNKIDPTTNAKIQWSGLLQPRRWTQAFGWMCFIPMTRSLLSTPPFSTLARMPAYYYDDKEYEYRMELNDRNEWDALGDAMLDVAVRLKKHVDRGAVLPYHPRGWGYHKTYTSSGKLRALFRASRDWFLVWMGAISFLVAHCKTPDAAKKKQDNDQQTHCTVQETPNDAQDKDQLDALARREERKLQAWEKLLVQFPHLAPFVQQLGSSPITNFGVPGTPPPRVGLVVEFTKLDHPSQPSIPWLVSKDVPVWYVWNQEAHRHAVQNGLEHLMPPSHLIQAHHTFLDHQPSLPFTNPASLPFTDPAPSSAPASEKVHSPTRSPSPYSGPSAFDKECVAARKQAIDAVLAKYEARAANIRQTWSPADAQKAAQRQKQPPKSSAIVEVYNIDFLNPSKLLREIVVRADRAETIDDHSDEQRRYFPELNLWVCSECMVPPVIVPFTGDDDDTYSNPGLDEIPRPEPGTPTAPFTIFSQKLSHFSRDPEGFQQPHSSLEDFACEVQGIMYRFYGYVPSLPCPVSKDPKPMDSKKRAQLARAIGLQESQTPLTSAFYQSVAASDALLFIENTAFSRQEINLSDLEEGNRLYLTNHRLSNLVIIERSAPNPPPLEQRLAAPPLPPTSKRAGHSQQRQASSSSCIPPGSTTLKHGQSSTAQEPPAEVTPYWFLFDNEIQCHGSLPWKLALTCASDALMVARLPASMSWEEVVKFLIQNGVPFRTFHPAQPVVSVPYHPLPASLPYRLSGYRFTPDDYRTYEHQRNLILGHPRMRAALLRGGLLWRIAVSYLDAESALLGPSHSALPLSAVHPRTSGQLIDDDLTPFEENLLIGTYICFTNNGEQVAVSSWWPPSAVFNQGDEYGRWTALNEEWFQKRLQRIREGTAEPIGRAKWRNVTRGRLVSRALKREVEKRSRKFIDKVLPATYSHLMLDHFK